MAYAGKCQESLSGLDGKMTRLKIALSLATVFCFSSSVFASASVHTLIEAEIREQRNAIMVNALLDMPPRALGEVRI